MQAAADTQAEVLDLLDVGVGVFDRDLRLRFCNNAFRALRRYPENVCKEGVALEELLRFNATRGDFGDGDIEAQVAERMSEITASGEREIERRMADGQILLIRYRRMPESGGLLITFEERTAERRAEDALRASEERHSLVTRATSDGIYDWDVERDVLYVSDNVTSLLDFDLTEGPSVRWAERVHPDDYPGYHAELTRHFRGESDAVEFEYRVRARGGGYRWVRDRGVGQRAADGRVTRLVGAISDVTDVKTIEAASRRATARLMASMSTIADGILLVGPDNRVELFNDRYVEIFSNAAGGADLSDLVVVGTDFFDMIRGGYNMGMFKPHPDGADAWIEARIKAWETETAKWELELANGSWILLNERRMPDGGRISVYTDITEFKRREAETEASRQRFVDAIEAITAGFALFDAEDRIVIWNKRFEDYFHQMREVFVPGRSFSAIMIDAIGRGLFPAARGDEQGFLERILERRRLGIGQVRENHLEDGRWLHITDHRTKEGGIVSIYTDMTERKQAEAALKGALAEFNAVLENINYGVMFMDADLKARIVNPAFRRLWHIPQAFIDEHPSFMELMEYNRHRNFYDVAEEDWEDFTRSRVDAVRAGDIPPVEVRRKDGTVVSYQCVALPDGGRMLTYFDITEQKDREAALERALGEFNALLENVDYGILFYDRDLRARIGNRAYREMWDQPLDYLETHPHFRDLAEYNRTKGVYDVPDEDWDRWLDGRVAAVQRGTAPPTELHRKDGKILRYQVVALPDGGRMLTYFDITDMKRAEQAARESEERVRGILENSPIGVAVIDDEDTIHFHNQQFARILRGPGRDLVGESSTQFRTDHVAVEDWQSRFREDGRVVRREMRYRGLDGADVWSQTTYERTEWEDVPARLTWIYDVTEEKANREALVEARDRAEAALADLRKAQERLIQSEKMASLGQLTAGIAHEIKNPLNFVNNFARLSDELLGELAEVLEAPLGTLPEDGREDAEDLLQTVRDNLRKIDEHGRRADSIVKNMLLHSREGPSERQRVALNPIAEEALNLAYHGARAENASFNIEMVKRIDPGVGEVECYPQDLMRVFLNLISNGMYAAAKRGQAGTAGFAPRIELATRRVDGHVEVTVRDNGVGIPPDILDKIFLPFFTTKPAGEGTGLGLSLSYDIIVKQHGGNLAVESEPGDHTSFTVTLPAN